jgi:hypothetical protein
MVAPAESRQTQLDEAMRFLNVVCGGLVVSVAALAMVAWFMASGPGALGLVGPPLPDALVYLGVAVDVGMLLAAPIVHRKLLERAAVTVRADEQLDTAVEGFRLATLLAFILREGAAIVGLMLTLLTNQPAWCYALGALAVVAMIWGWPRQEQLAGLLAGAPAT